MEIFAGIVVVVLIINIGGQILEALFFGPPKKHFNVITRNYEDLR